MLKSSRTPFRVLKRRLSRCVCSSFYHGFENSRHVTHDHLARDGDDLLNIIIALSETAKHRFVVHVYLELLSTLNDVRLVNIAPDWRTATLYDVRANRVVLIEARISP